MAQTTQNASFGPVLIISAHTNRHCRVKSYIKLKYYYLVEKNTIFISKTRTYGPNDAKRIVRAHSHHLRPSRPLLWCQIIYRT